MLMKKIFTLIAAAFMVASVNAQSWVLPTGVVDGIIPEGTTLLDNDFATVKTANNDAAPYELKDEDGNSTTEKVGDYSFGYGVNVRIDAAPNAANPTGTPHTAGDGSANIAIVVEAKQTTDVVFYIRIGSTKTFDGYNQTTGESVSGTLVADNPTESNLYAAATFPLQGGATYTFYTRGGTTRLYAIDTKEGTYVAPSTSIYANASASVVDGFSTMTYGDGAKVALTGNADKAFSSGSSITIDGKKYTSTKVSNGAANTFYAPEGQKVYTFTIYSYVNIDAENRPPYWAQVGDNIYTADDATIMQSYKDGANPDVNTYTFAEGLSEVVFKNAGEQVCFVLEVDYNAPAAGGDDDVNSIKEVVKDINNGAVYNLAGQKVDENYKGVAIKNGKKMLQK